MNEPNSQENVRRIGCAGCLGGGLAGFLVAILLLVVIALFVAAKKVPTRADHERAVRENVTTFLQNRPSDNGGEELVKGLLLFGNSLAQGADVSYIDLLGFQYHEHTFYSEVLNPKEPEGKQRVTFGIFGKVYPGDSSKRPPTPAATEKTF